MYKNVGLWIDRKNTYIVSIDKVKDRQTFASIESGIEERLSLSGRSRTRKTSFGPQSVSSEGTIDERRKHQLRQYYQEIIKRIGGVRRIMIFGPGEAKNELEKEIRKSKALASRIVHIETADNMTATQIKAKVRNYFIREE